MKQQKVRKSGRQWEGDVIICQLVVDMIALKHYRYITKTKQKEN